MEAVSSKIHFGAIDGLRAYSALGIVLMHVLANGFDNQLNGFVFDSLIGSFTNLVFLFMVVSAFGTCCGYFERIRTGTISLSDFYKKRYLKIWPFFALLVLIDVILSPRLDSIYGAFADLTLAFGLLPNAGNISVIGVGWFLGLVFVFYMLFPFFSFLLENKKRAWFSFVITLAFNLIGESCFQIGRNNILYSACYFMAGGLIFLYKDQWIRFMEKFKFMKWILILIIIALAVVYYLVSASTFTMLPLFSLMLLYAVGGGTGRRNKLLYNPLTRFLSGISMEIYLCHMVFYRAVERLHLLYIVGNGVLGYIIACLLILVGAIIFSFAMQKTIDFIMKKISNRRRKTE